MLSPQALTQEIRTYCSQNANPANAQKYARYFKEGYDAWGLLDKNDPLWHAKQAEWLDRYRALGMRGILKTGELLFASGKYEEGSLAIRFLKEHKDEFDPRSLPLLARWFKAGIRNWAHTDVLCGEVIAPALVAHQIQFQDLASWRESEFPFQRRAVPVALLGLLKTKQTPGPLLASSARS